MHLGHTHDLLCTWHLQHSKCFRLPATYTSYTTHVLALVSLLGVWMHVHAHQSCSHRYIGSLCDDRNSTLLSGSQSIYVRTCTLQASHAMGGMPRPPRGHHTSSPCVACPHFCQHAHTHVCSYACIVRKTLCCLWCIVCVSGKDTHLHASFQRLMEEYEVKFLHGARKNDPDRVPKLTRQNILDVVRQAFREVPMPGWWAFFFVFLVAMW